MPLHRILTSVFFFLVFRIDTNSRRFADSDDDREEGEHIKLVPHYLLVGIRDPVDGATNRWGSNFVCRANTVKPGDEHKLNCELGKVEWNKELQMPYSSFFTTVDIEPPKNKRVELLWSYFTDDYKRGNIWK